MRAGCNGDAVERNAGSLRMFVGVRGSPWPWSDERNPVPALPAHRAFKTTRTCGSDRSSFTPSRDLIGDESQLRGASTIRGPCADRTAAGRDSPALRSPVAPPAHSSSRGSPGSVCSRQRAQDRGRGNSIHPERAVAGGDHTRRLGCRSDTSLIRFKGRAFALRRKPAERLPPNPKQRKRLTPSRRQTDRRRCARHRSNTRR